MSAWRLWAMQTAPEPVRGQALKRSRTTRSGGPAAAIGITTPATSARATITMSTSANLTVMGLFQRWVAGWTSSTIQSYQTQLRQFGLVSFALHPPVAGILLR